MQHLTSATRRGLQRLRRFMQSIRFRLTLWSVVILGLVLVVFSGFIVITQAHVLQVEAENQLQIQGQRLATYYDPESSRLRLPPFTSSREPLLTADSLVLIIDAQGAIVQQIGSLDATDAPRLIHSVVDRQGSPDPSMDAFILPPVSHTAAVRLT